MCILMCEHSVQRVCTSMLTGKAAVSVMWWRTLLMVFRLKAQLVIDWSQTTTWRMKSTKVQTLGELRVRDTAN